MVRGNVLEVYLLCYAKSSLYRVGMCTAIDLHMKYAPQIGFS